MKRNYGIDLLKMLLMCMVVLLHVLGYGGVLNAVTPFTANYYAVWMLESLAYCAINGYAIITGYLYIDGRHRFSSVILLWIQALFYMVGITVGVWILKPQIFYMPDLMKAIFLISTGTYWYLSAYIGLFIMIPFLNAAVHALPEREMKKLLFLMFLVFSGYATLSTGDPFGQMEGYSMIWLMLLYIIGACIKKYDLGSSLSVGRALLLYVLFSFISWGVKMGIEASGLEVAGKPLNSNILISYVSPTMLLAAVMLFLAFKKMTFPTWLNKVLAVFSPAVFGVYLIHKHEYVDEFIIKDRFAEYAESATIPMIGLVLFTAIVIFTICILIDWIRYKVFKLLKLKQWLEKMEQMLGRKYSD